jgi:glycine dehydrogenase subunit 2
VTTTSPAPPGAAGAARSPRHDSWAAAISESDIGARLSFDRGAPGRQAVQVADSDVPATDWPAESLQRTGLDLPEMDQLSLVRYFTALSRMNYSIDTGLYPLGSCTMKYNPKVNEDAARLPGLSAIHPMQPAETVQGALGLMASLQCMLAEITGMAAVSLCPAAGAHGELTGVLVIKAALADRGEAHRRKILVPDSAHGTNPATAAMAGFEVVAIDTDPHGNMDLEQLRGHLGPDVAGLMITNPNTLGLFESNIVEICRLVHVAGGLVYGDGANLNAIVGQVKPGDLGFDVVHMNLHKTFSTPHGGGGPGSGPIAVTEELTPFLPDPIVAGDGQGGFLLKKPEKTIGKVGAFHGNFGMHVRAYTYIRALGADGLREMSENAVLNANYVFAALRDVYDFVYDRDIVMHEAVFSGRRQKAKGSSTLDIAKRMIDYGYHPPTIYFPLIVPEALMIEPTESESRETLDEFIATMRQIAHEAETDPALLEAAPHATPVRRLDEATAARKPYLRWRKAGE